MFNKKSRIYVAGHTGLLGSALIKTLSAKGFAAIITRSHKELDLTNQNQVNSFFRKECPEYIFLCAGLTGGITYNKNFPADFLHINMSIQDNLFQSAHQYHAQGLIFYGSSCMYPKNCAQPIKEEYLLRAEVEPTSRAYALAKICGIEACHAYNHQYKLNRFIALIPNSIYGPNDNFDSENGHVLSALITKFYEAKTKNKNEVILWGSGNPRREFIFSEDAAEASIFALKNSRKLQNSHYNVGTGEDYSIKKLASIIAEITGFKGKIKWDKTKPDGTPRKLLDSSKFRAIGWKPRISFVNGVEKTFNWFLKNAG